MKAISVLAAVVVLVLGFRLPAQGKAVPQGALVRLATPAITVTPNQGKPEQTFTVQGTGFACHNGTAVAVVSFDDTTLNGSGTPVGCDGTFTVTARVPSTATLGAHTITARGFAPAGPSTATPEATDTAVAPTETPTITSTAPATSVPPTSVPPTSVPPTSVPPTAVPPTAVPPTQVPTQTALPTSTPLPTLAPPTSVPPTLPVIPLVLPTPTFIPTIPPTLPPPTPTPTPFEETGGTQTGVGFSNVTYQMVDHSKARSRSLADGTFDGDQASATFTVVAPSAPFTISQTVSCPTTPVAGVTSSCTIVETVNNTGPHALDFSHTVTNNLAPGVQARSSSATTGTIAVSGSAVVWNNFQLAPGQSASASIQVVFTPPSSSAGGTFVLSDGISADAVDVVTGQRFGVTFGTLRTPVAAPSGSTGGTGTGTGVVQPAVQQPASGSGSGHGGATLGGLPSTGGAVGMQGRRLGN